MDRTANTFKVKFKSVVEVGSHEGEPYTGAYEVIPKREEQVLPTAHKYMTDDVTVHEIPWVETPTVGTNGNTFIIAS